MPAARQGSTKSVPTGEPASQCWVVAEHVLSLEDSMHTFIARDHTGESRHHFERRFRELSKVGYTAAKRAGNGMSEVIHQFDPTVKETLFIPRLVGG
jgi:hypothetical protein